ncbi:uncharacterized protein EV422DRAFT_619011 [Fimicolochytrium jonesii]|uniref:uncharacterized protein n=1 Tax=Fimicolochytrium jonesii TaxID=1396493 RepID=UPI0022FE99A4|nr:uncharacterized protein EV422DRAFT_619011 [Fimicolochytrium jonesii]KAI8822539.1 hypothetical protein EV422DRAFT_619011 [Fimicolochytrium jonesii]
MPSHQALQGHLWCGIFTGATTPRRKRRKVAPVTPRLPIRLPTAVQTPLQPPPRFEFPPSVQRHLPQAIADMVSESSGESSGDEDGQQQQLPQRGLSPADRGLQRPLNLRAPIPFLFPSTPGGSLVLEPPPPPPVQRPRPQTHASTKVSLHRIIHNQVQREQRERLTTFIGNVHILARHTSFFLKYYLADHPLHDFPDITDKHISVIFELLNNPGYNGNPVIAQQLHPWVQDYCDVHGFAPIRMRYCQQTAAYTATSIFTNLKVNVQEHFMQMFLRYVNERLGLKQVVLHLRRAGVNRVQRRHYYQRVRQFKKYATFEEFPTEEEFARLTRLERTVLDKLWALFPPQDEPLAYSLAVDAMPYLGAYCELSRLYEHCGMRLFSVIPLRKSQIKSSVRIDTKILATHILGLSHHCMGKLTDQRKRELWGQFLNINDKVFKHRKKLGLKFDGSISTNGYSATIHFKKPGLKYGHGARKRSKAQMQEEVKQLYFEHHIAKLREAPNIISIDPGKHYLLFCRDIKKERPFRYTSNQRAVETKSRYFQRDMRERKINAGIAEMESHIPSHKSMNIEAFSAFIVDHIHADPALDEFYQDEIHVARRFKAFSLRQKSESKLIKNMRRRYGKNFSVILGDWSDAGKTMRFQESSKTKGFRTLFARNSIPCYLLDEYRTSSVCPDCHGRVKKNILQRLSSRPWQARKGRMEYVHGLVVAPIPNVSTKTGHHLRFLEDDHYDYG